MQLFYELSGSISEPLCTTVEDFAVHTESGGSLEQAEALGTSGGPGDSDQAARIGTT